MDIATEEANTPTTEEIFVGRERELAAVRDCLRRRDPTIDSFFFIEGDPGIGKTRLCSELAALGRADGARVLAVRCREEAPEYGMWRDVVASAPLLARLAPGLSLRLAEAASEGAEVPTEIGRFALCDAVARFLERAACARPLLVVLDDLHLADQASLTLLQYVVRNSRGAAITIAATYCGPELRGRPEAAAILGELVRGAHASTLEGFGMAEVDRLLEADGISARPAVVRALHRRSGGNPTYLRALVRSPGAKSWLAVDGEEEMPGTLPETVRESIERRLSALSPTCREALQVASAIGLEFELGTVARAYGTEVDIMRKSLDEAVAAGLVRPAGTTSDAFSFVHGVTREALREEWLRARRVALPRRVESTDSGNEAERPTRTTGCFLLDGRYWTVKYDGAIVRLRDSAGMRCIAHLLLYQEEAIHVRNLARFARVARAGAWGRERDFTDPQVEMAVVERVKGALELIADFHPALGGHLKASIRTGLFCAYLPEPGQLISWLL